METVEWRPGPSLHTLCRCCLADGCYKDISTEYFWMGKREVYSEMLSSALDITISYSQSGGPNSNSRLICETCIARLRDATDFKKQVLDCEKTFLQHIDPGRPTTTVIEISPAPAQSGVKLEQVKEEKSITELDDLHDYNDAADVVDDEDDDDDDLDDQPLTKLASKIPKKETADILDLLDNKEATKRKSTIKIKVKSKKSKKDKGKAKLNVKPSASKEIIKKEKKRDESRNDPARRNAEIIIRYTTAYPFRVNIKSILCVYCGDTYDDPKEFRRHMAEEHKTFSLNMAFIKLPKAEFVKVDLSELKCRLCFQNFQSLDSVASHLIDAHNKAIQTRSKLGVMPYVLNNDRWNCAVCDKNLPSLLHLNKHTITHFLSYVCEVCGKSYVASTGLIQHVRLKHEMETNTSNQDYKIYCRRCQKVFSSTEAKMQHQRTEKRCMPHCCSKCPERFPSWELKQKHMVELHGMVKTSYQCKDCDVTCSDRRAFYDHFKMFHSQDCLVCVHCGLKFASTSRLNRHLGKHTL